MTKTDLYPNIVSLIKEARSQLNKIKRLQFVGASSIQIRSLSTSQLQASVLDYSFLTYEAVFVADEQDNAFVQLDYETSRGTSSNRDDKLFAEIYRGYSDNPRETKWKFKLYNHYSTTQTIYTRWYLQSTAHGTLTVTQI